MSKKPFEISRGQNSGPSKTGTLNKPVPTYRNNWHLSAIAIAKADEDQLVMGELVKPEELGELIVFLSSGSCRHLTGSTIDVNGASYIR